MPVRVAATLIAAVWVGGVTIAYAAAVTEAASDATASGSSSVPTPGTVEWAIALDDARREARLEPETPEVLVVRYRRLLDLYPNCAACRTGVYDNLKDALRHYFHNQKTVDAIEEEEVAGDPVGFSKLLMRTGRRDEAEEVARQSLERVQLVERRAELYWVLAEACFHRNETEKRTAILERASSEAALKPDTCPFAPESSEMERIRGRFHSPSVLSLTLLYNA
jgi:NifU-like protein involved in Fe-S cluster formation